jgi:hypothetical protein
MSDLNGDINPSVKCPSLLFHLTILFALIVGVCKHLGRNWFGPFAIASPYHIEIINPVDPIYFR